MQYWNALSRLKVIQRRMLSVFAALTCFARGLTSIGSTLRKICRCFTTNLKLGTKRLIVHV